MTGDMEDLSKVCSLPYVDARCLQRDSDPFRGKISRRSEFMKRPSRASFTLDVRSSRLVFTRPPSSFGEISSRR